MIFSLNKHISVCSSNVHCFFENLNKSKTQTESISQSSVNPDHARIVPAFTIQNWACLVEVVNQQNDIIDLVCFQFFPNMFPKSQNFAIQNVSRCCTNHLGFPDLGRLGGGRPRTRITVAALITCWPTRAAGAAVERMSCEMAITIFTTWKCINMCV